MPSQERRDSADAAVVGKNMKFLLRLHVPDFRVPIIAAMERISIDIFVRDNLP